MVLPDKWERSDHLETLTKANWGERAVGCARYRRRGAVESERVGGALGQRYLVSLSLSPSFSGSNSRLVSLPSNAISAAASPSTASRPNDSRRRDAPSRRFALRLTARWNYNEKGEGGGGRRRIKRRNQTRQSQGVVGSYALRPYSLRTAASSTSQKGRTDRWSSVAAPKGRHCCICTCLKRKEARGKYRKGKKQRKKIGGTNAGAVVYLSRERAHSLSRYCRCYVLELLIKPFGDSFPTAAIQSTLVWLFSDAGSSYSIKAA